MNIDHMTYKSKHVTFGMPKIKRVAHKCIPHLKVKFWEGIGMGDKDKKLEINIVESNWPDRGGIVFYGDIQKKKKIRMISWIKKEWTKWKWGFLRIRKSITKGKVCYGESDPMGNLWG